MKFCPQSRFIGGQTVQFGQHWRASPPTPLIWGLWIRAWVFGHIVPEICTERAVLENLTIFVNLIGYKCNKSRFLNVFYSIQNIFIRDRIEEGDLGLCLFSEEILEKRVFFTRFFGTFLKNWPLKNLFFGRFARGIWKSFCKSKIFPNIDFYCIFRPFFFEKLPKFSKTAPSAPISGASRPKNVSFFGGFGAESVSFFSNRSPPIRFLIKKYLKYG